MAAWWNDALQHWCVLAGLSAEVRQRAPLRAADAARETGTWWIPTDRPGADAGWRVELDPTAYACFPPTAHVDKPHQDALTWMLRSAFAARGPSTPITAAGRLAQWATRPNAELIAALAGAPTSQAVPSLARHGQDVSIPPQFTRHRGYLLWLRFPTETRPASAVSTPPADREFAQTVDDVIEAFDPGSWREWLADADAGAALNADGSPESGASPKVARSRAGSTSLLLFVSEAALEDYAARDDGQVAAAEASPSRPGDLYLPQLRDVIRGFAADLMQMMESDALTSCTIAISQLLPRMGDVPDQWPREAAGRVPSADVDHGDHASHGERLRVLDAALASLVLAHRGRGVGLRRDRIVQFGEDALVHLVQALPPAGHEVIGRLSSALHAGDSLRAGDSLHAGDSLRAGDALHAGGTLPNYAVDTLVDLPETLQAMVAANLNVSEAARLLFLHRNTLQGRIERVREVTGRDLRNFDDAVSLLVTLLAHRASHTPHR